MRRWVVGLALASALVVPAIAATAPPAYAQQDFVESDPAVARAREQLEAAQLAAHRAAAVLEATNQNRADVQADIDAHLSHIEGLRNQRADLAFQRTILEAVMRQRAAALYRAGGDGTGIASIVDAGSALEGARRQTLGQAAAQSNQRAARALTETRIQLGTLQDSLQGEEATLRTARDRLDSLAADQEAQQADLDQRVAEANAALAQARAIGALHAAGEPVMGPSLLRADQLAAWVRAQGYHPRIETDLVNLAQIFIDEGAAEGVRGDFAFAQSVIETGGFESAPDNNFSGIGWCDSCRTGNRFPDPRQGVRAQIQLLREYADAGVTAAQLANPVSPYLYGADPVAANRKFDAFYAKGWAPTWSDMGKGNWATDPDYSGKVISVYRRMVAFASGS
ncbi:MAG: glucosaminidase domain-containing protein [Acidimicrobiia bacterium]